MKKKVFISLALIATLLLSGCNSKSTTTNKPSSNSKNKDKITSENVTKDIVGKKVDLAGNNVYGGLTYTFKEGDFTSEVKSSHIDSDNPKAQEVIATVDVNAVVDEADSNYGFQEKIKFKNDLKLYYLKGETGWQLDKVEKNDSNKFDFTQENILPDLKPTDDEIKNNIYKYGFSVIDDLNADGVTDYLKITQDTLKSFKVIGTKNLEGHENVRYINVYIEFAGKNPEDHTDKTWNGKGNLQLEYDLQGTGSNAVWDFSNITINKDSFNCSAK